MILVFDFDISDILLSQENDTNDFIYGGNKLTIEFPTDDFDSFKIDCKSKVTEEKPVRCGHCTCLVKGNPYKGYFKKDDQIFTIPYKKINNSYKTFGVFCSPHCAYTFNHYMHDIHKHHREELLREMLIEIYGFKSALYIAPDKTILNHYYGGILSEKEYQNMLKNNTHKIIVENPMMRLDNSTIDILKRDSYL